MKKHRLVSQSIFGLMIIASLALTACKKSDGGGGVAAPVGQLAPVGCVAGQSPALLANAVGTAQFGGGQVDVRVDFMATAGYNAADPKAVTYYSGAASLIGDLRFSVGGGGFGTCGVYPGNYYFRTGTPGNMSMADLKGGTMISDPGPNGGIINATIVDAVIYNGTDPQGTNKCSTSNRVFLNLRLDSVNGQPCGLSIMSY